jgi:xylulokinase
MSVLGIDLGTSGLRALLVDDAGLPLASVSRDYASSHPHPGWSEQDPALWIAALEDAVCELKATCPAFSDLRAIGVSGHMHGATLLDASGQVIRPCILWNDTRSHREAAELDAAPGVRALSGNIVFPGFTAPKLAWLQRNEPQAFERVNKVLLPAGYLNFYLTGQAVSDISDSAGTSWLDVGQRTWSPELLAASKMRQNQMPRLIEGCQAAGQIRPELASRWGVTGKVVIAGGAGDNAASACGIGALNEGQGFVSLGTSGVLLMARDGYRPAPETALHTFCHALPDRWYQMGVMLSATASLNWLSNVCGQEPKALTAALGERLRAPSAVGFLPYLAGERTPHNDAGVRGVFYGLEDTTTREDLTHTVLTGVAFGLRDTAQALAGVGLQPRQLFAIGGGSASRYWLRLIATVLDCALAVPQGSEFGAALGAARLGLVAAGVGQVEEVMTAPQIRETIEPDAVLQSDYEAAYQAFRQAYPLARGLSGLGLGSRSSPLSTDAL